MNTTFWYNKLIVLHTVHVARIGSARMRSHRVLPSSVYWGTSHWVFNVNTQTCVQPSPLRNGKMTDIQGDCYIQVNLRKVKGNWKFWEVVWWLLHTRPFIQVWRYILFCSPAERLVLGETVPEVGLRWYSDQDWGHSFFQYGPPSRWITFSLFSYWDLKSFRKFTLAFNLCVLM